MNNTGINVIDVSIITNLRTVTATVTVSVAVTVASTIKLGNEGW